MSWWSSKKEVPAPPPPPPPAPAVVQEVLQVVPSFSFGTHPADIQEISVATVLGACSGFAAKKIAKGAGLAVGLGFMSLQALTYSGFVKVDWSKFENMAVQKLDVDLDGKLTQNDFKIMATRLLHNLVTDLPSAGGFSAAFFLGFRYG
ncbi:FUN14 family-domain-containing protein [Obelidium mucronatum]|nr:FUN14 family-domain-containing protein [Obelidium mucronatum]